MKEVKVLTSQYKHVYAKTRLSLHCSIMQYELKSPALNKLAHPYVLHTKMLFACDNDDSDITETIMI